MATPEALSLIPASVLRNLSDKLYEKRKHAALELEGIVKQLAVAGDHDKITAVINLLTQEYTYSPQANHRKGGLIGLAAVTVGLTSEAAQHLEVSLRLNSTPTTGEGAVLVGAGWYDDPVPASSRGHSGIIPATHRRVCPATHFQHPISTTKLPESPAARRMDGGVDGGIGSCPRGLGVGPVLGGGEEGRAGVGLGYRSGAKAGLGKGVRRRREAREDRFRVGSWNIRTLQVKSVELVKILKKKRINIVCVHETRWVGSKARDVDGYKLWYSGSVRHRNGVGVLVDESLEGRWWRL
ncbi:hypothetical protein FXO37_03284 [Capsicum annuum]|nr:hypothetical protein FXO37_03284 [Capsicum annuum]